MSTLAELLEPVKISIEDIINDAKEVAGEVLEKLKELPMTLIQKAVSLVKETSLGTAIYNLVSAAANSNESGEAKYAAVADKLYGAYQAFQENGGFKGLVAAGVSILRVLIEFAVAEFKNAFSK